MVKKEGERERQTDRREERKEEKRKRRMAPQCERKEARNETVGGTLVIQDKLHFLLQTHKGTLGLSISRHFNHRSSLLFSLEEKKREEEEKRMDDT